MRRFLLFLTLLLTALVLSADPDEEMIKTFANRYQTPCEGGKITLKVNTRGEGFIYYYVRRECPHKGKHAFGMPLFVVPSQKKIFVGQYFNLKRIKEGVTNPAVVARFFSDFLGGKVTMTLEKENAIYKSYTFAVESGYGPIHYTVYRFGKLHVILGRAYTFGDDPRQIRLDTFPWGKYPSMGSSSAPHKLAVYLDAECPMCAKTEKSLIRHLKTHKDIYTTFVQFPLITIHPWAFRAACGALCFNSVSTDTYFDYMEEIYAQRGELNIDTIDAAVFGFGDARALRSMLLECYMKPGSIKGVLEQLDLAISQGVSFTPGLFYDGTLMLPSDLLPMLEKKGK